jgi:hypothetical protein
MDIVLEGVILDLSLPFVDTVSLSYKGAEVRGVS